MRTKSLIILGAIIAITGLSVGTILSQEGGKEVSNGIPLDYVKIKGTVYHHPGDGGGPANEWTTVTAENPADPPLRKSVETDDNGEYQITFGGANAPAGVYKVWANYHSPIGCIASSPVYTKDITPSDTWNQDCHLSLIQCY